MGEIRHACVFRRVIAPRRSLVAQAILLGLEGKEVEKVEFNYSDERSSQFQSLHIGEEYLCTSNLMLT